MNRIQQSLVVLLPCLYSHIACAQTVASQTSPFSLSNITPIIVGLLVCIGLIILTAFILKRMMGFKVGIRGEINIVSGVSLGTREKLVLIAVGDTYILVGMTPNSINKIHKFDEKPFQETNEVETKQPSFASMIQESLRKGRLQ